VHVAEAALERVRSLEECGTSGIPSFVFVLSSFSQGSP